MAGTLTWRGLQVSKFVWQARYLVANGGLVNVSSHYVLCRNQIFCGLVAYNLTEFILRSLEMQRFAQSCPLTYNRNWGTQSASIDLARSGRAPLNNLSGLASVGRRFRS